MGVLALWDLEVARSTSRLVHDGSVRSCVELQDGRLLTGGSILRLWDVRTARCTATMRPSSGDEVLSMVELADETVAVGSHQAKLQLWDVRQMAMLREVCGQSLLAGIGGASQDTTQAEAVACIAQLRDGRLVTGAGHSAWLWESDTLQCVARAQGHEDDVCCVVELMDRRIVTGSEDCTLRVWGRPLGQGLECAMVLAGHQGAVWCVTGDGWRPPQLGGPLYA